MLKQLIKPYLSLLLTSSLYAGGTLAGTIIQTSSTINYVLGEESFTQESNSTALEVLPFSDLHTTPLIQAPVLANLGKESYLPFKITNRGNGIDQFNLQVLNINANKVDDFDISFGQVYIKYMEDNNNSMIPFSLSQPIILEAGASIKVMIGNTMPSKMKLNTKSQVELQASSQTFTKLINNASAIGEYKITGASQDAIIVKKTSTVKEVDAGQRVSFLLSITIQKDITGVTLHNPIETNGRYETNSLHVNDMVQTVHSDEDIASIVDGILMVNLNSIQAGSLYKVTYDLLIPQETDTILGVDSNETLE